MREKLLWENVLKRIESEVNSLVYATWFKGTKLSMIDDNNKVVISVPTELHQMYLPDSYYEIIYNNLSMEIGKVNMISFVVEELSDDKEYVGKHVKNALN